MGSVPRSRDRERTICACLALSRMLPLQSRNLLALWSFRLSSFCLLLVFERITNADKFRARYVQSAVLTPSSLHDTVKACATQKKKPASCTFDIPHVQEAVPKQNNAPPYIGKRRIQIISYVQTGRLQPRDYLGGAGTLDQALLMRGHVAQLDLTGSQLVAADNHDVGGVELIGELELGLQ